MSLNNRHCYGIIWAGAVFTIVVFSVVLVLVQTRDDGSLDSDVVLPSASPDVVTLNSSIASTVLIRGVGCGAGTIGTGAVIDGGVVTNAHVVAGSTSIEVESVNGGRHDAVVVSLDPVRDLALLDVPALVAPSLAVSTPIPGDPVVILARGASSFSEAIITPIDAVVKRIINITISDIYDQGNFQRHGLELIAKIRPGDSGAPVINAQGDVVGLVFSASRMQLEIAYAISGVEFKGLINSRSSTPVETGACRHS